MLRVDVLISVIGNVYGNIFTRNKRLNFCSIFFHHSETRSCKDFGFTRDVQTDKRLYPLTVISSGHVLYEER